MTAPARKFLDSIEAGTYPGYRTLLHNQSKQDT